MFGREKGKYKKNNNHRHKDYKSTTKKKTPTVDIEQANLMTFCNKAKAQWLE